MKRKDEDDGGKTWSGRLLPDVSVAANDIIRSYLTSLPTKQ